MINVMEEIKKGQYLFPNSIEEIDKMTGEQFEDFLFWYYKKCNYQIMKTPKTNDNGIDLILTFFNDETKRNMNIGIQAKRWSNPIPKKEVVKMSEGKDFYKLDYLWIITTSRLTIEANLYATNHEITVQNRENIKNILSDLKTMDNVKFTRNNNQEREFTSNYTFTEKDKIIISKLKQYRNKIAEENSIPRYLVFNNKTLKDLIIKKPKSSIELESISGLGKSKINKYGDDLLKIISDTI